MEKKKRKQGRVVTRRVITIDKEQQIVKYKKRNAKETQEHKQKNEKEKYRPFFLFIVLI